MFIGEYAHTIDAKNRIIMPAKFREGLGEKFIVSKGLDNCLFVYPMSEWNNLEEKLKSLPLASKDARAFSRFFFASATECEIDKQGRILIPSVLKDFANLDKDIVITGVSTRIEIWNKEKWDNYTGESGLEDPEGLAEKMALLGI